MRALHVSLPPCLPQQYMFSPQDELMQRGHALLLQAHILGLMVWPIGHMLEQQPSATGGCFLSQSPVFRGSVVRPCLFFSRRIAINITCRHYNAFLLQASSRTQQPCSASRPESCGQGLKVRPRLRGWHKGGLLHPSRINASAIKSVWGKCSSPARGARSHSYATCSSGAAAACTCSGLPTPSPRPNLARFVLNRRR